MTIINTVLSENFIVEIFKEVSFRNVSHEIESSACFWLKIEINSLNWSLLLSCSVQQTTQALNLDPILGKRVLLDSQDRSLEVCVAVEWKQG